MARLSVEQIMRRMGLLDGCASYRQGLSKTNMSNTVTPNDILDARVRIRDHVTKTPLVFCPFLSDSAKVYFKMESEQKTGSFKIRGAFNKLLLLAEKDPTSLKAGLVTASSGNYGIGCIMAAKTVGCDLEVVCTETSSPVKRAFLNYCGARVSVHGKDFGDAEARARIIAEERNAVYVSSYNDPDVLAGYGTVGIELLEDLPTLDVVFVAVGSGGNIAGIASYIKHVKPEIQVIGCQPFNSKVMYESIKAGHIVFTESLDTLSDGTTGGIEEDAITFEMNKNYVDDWLLVTEEQIAESIYFMLDKHHKVVEGAAGVAIAAFMFNKERFGGKTVAIVSCGSNIGMPSLKNILNKYCLN